MTSGVSVLSRRTPVLLATLFAGGIAWTLIRFPGSEVVCLTASLCLLLAASTRFDLTNLMIAFVISQPLAQFLKRAIFLIGPQHQLVYYSIQTVSTVLFALALLVALRRLRWHTLPRSGKLLLGFLALVLGTTALAPGPAGPLSRLAALLTAVLPIAAFYVGAAMGLPGLLRLGRVMVVVAVVSTAYGLVQLVGGPTGVEKAWAMATNEYSIHGGKVFQFLQGGPDAPLFRPFSFYPDPYMWGVFLLDAFALLFLLHLHHRISRRSFHAGVVAILLGLFLTLCRSPLLGFVATVGTYQLLRLPSVRRPWLIACLVPLGFLLVVKGGNYMLANFMGGAAPDHPLLARFLTVGTIDARVGAWDMLLHVIRTNWLLGDGWMYNPVASVQFAEFAALDLMLSHNFVVELVLYAGVPGLALYCLFHLQWFREARGAMLGNDPTASLTARWITAFIIGFMAFGLFTGAIFMTFEYFLVLGAFSTYAAHCRQEARLASLRSGGHPTGVAQRPNTEA